MKEKKNIIYIILIIIIVLCIIFAKNIRYYFAGDKDIAISVPTGFYFEITNKDDKELYEISGLNNTTYITVDEKYLNNDDVQLYVTGKYWNSPETPLVKLNGKVIDEVSTENTGNADGVFSKTYFSKYYHFYINETIEEDKEYTFYIRIRNISQSIKVIFTTRETMEEMLLTDYEADFADEE